MLTLGAVEMAPANEKINEKLSISAIPVRRSEKRKIYENKDHFGLSTFDRGTYSPLGTTKNAAPALVRLL